MCTGRRRRRLCCLGAGGSAANGLCVDRPFLECVNSGGVYSRVNAEIEGEGENPDGACIYGKDEEYECPDIESACDPIGLLGIHLSSDGTASVDCYSSAAGLAMPGCSDGACCELVSAVDPFCSRFQDSGSTVVGTSSVRLPHVSFAGPRVLPVPPFPVRQPSV